MTMRAWLSPPRRLLALFFAVTLAPAAGLVWLGWRLLQQDRQLEMQRAMERRESAADRIVGILQQELYVVAADGGRPERLPVSWKDKAGDVDTFRCALSAEARTVYFVGGTRPEELCIYSMSAGGGERRAVTEPTTREPALSPDGSKIAYLKSRPDQQVAASYQVWTRPVEGGEPVLACELPDPRWIRSPVWSPDGRMIAFLASEKGNVHRPVWTQLSAS